MMLYFARMTGGTVPVGTDSGTVFTECLTILADETTRAMVTEVKRSEFYSLSIDEKDRMAVLYWSRTSTRSTTKSPGLWRTATWPGRTPLTSPTSSLLPWMSTS